MSDFSSQVPLEQQARTAALEYAKRIRWNWFLTLTFERNVDEETARQAHKIWAGMLARRVLHQHFSLGWVTDRQPSGRLHIHAVLGFFEPGVPVPSNPSVATTTWAMLPRRFATSAGHNDARLYDPTGKALEYMFLGHSGAEWNVACTRSGECKRRNGCACVPYFKWRSMTPPTP